MKTFYYVRHGESEGNAAGRLVGGTWDTPLTKLGEDQARQAAESLQDKTIDLIVSSPLSRAKKTADIIARHIGYAGDVLTNDLLKERDFGTASGKPRARAFELLDTGKAQGVESVDAFYDRMVQVVTWLKSLPGEQIIVTGHAGCARMIKTVIEGAPAADFLKHQGLDNAAIYEFAL